MADQMLTLVEAANRLDPNGMVAKVVDMTTKKNEFLQVLPFMPTNGDLSHVYSHVTALPGGIDFVQIGEGYEADKSRTDMQVETCGMLAARTKVPVKLVDLYGSKGMEFRAQEDARKIAAAHHKVEESLLYASVATNIKAINGLTPRFDVTSGNPAASQILKHTAVPSGSDQTSIWLVGVGRDGVYGIYPRNVPAGLQMEDMDKQYVEDADGKEYLAYCTDYSWNFGLCVEDWRRVVRGCNIDVSALSKSADDLVPLMMDMLDMVETGGDVTWYFLVNRRIRNILRHQARNKVAASTLTFETIGGKRVLVLDDARVILTDSILLTEDIVA